MTRVKHVKWLNTVLIWKFDEDHQREMMSKRQKEHSAPSVHIKQMAAVQSKLMLYCGAISILLT